MVWRPWGIAYKLTALDADGGVRQYAGSKRHPLRSTLWGEARVQHTMKLRLGEHFGSGKLGSRWLKGCALEGKPVVREFASEREAYLQELEWALELRAEHTDKARGGPYSSVEPASRWAKLKIGARQTPELAELAELQRWPKQRLRHAALQEPALLPTLARRHMLLLCLLCGCAGHFASACSVGYPRSRVGSAMLGLGSGAGAGGRATEPRWARMRGGQRSGPPWRPWAWLARPEVAAGEEEARGPRFFFAGSGFAAFAPCFFFAGSGSPPFGEGEEARAGEDDEDGDPEARRRLAGALSEEGVRGG